MKNLLIAGIAVSVLALAGCDSNDGPMEEAGEKLDRSYEDARDAVEDASDEAADMVEEAGDKIEDATD